jgi:transposase-like protein
MNADINIMTLATRINSEAEAYLFLEGLRWSGKPVCPHCGNADKCYYLAPANGSTRKTRTGSASQRRVWKCAACRRQFSVLTGTIFHGTKIPVHTWLMVVFEMCASKNGVSAREIERKYDLTPKSAWFMTHRIREAMKLEPLAGMLRGTIVADETFIGGKEKNKHAKDRDPSNRGRSTKTKTAVFSLIHPESGEVRSRVVPDVDGLTLRKALEEHVDPANSTLHTDAWSGYRLAGPQFEAHETVDHSAGEYVRGDVSTNMAEGYFSQLKRSIDGTHHHVSREHLGRYLAEFDYRYTTRDQSDSDRMRGLVSKTGGRRLSYKPLTQD